MTQTFRLRVVTPDRTVLDEPVRAVQFMGADGSYGILPKHAAMITATAPGILTYVRRDGTRAELVVTEGFAEMLDNTLSIIAEAGETVGNIDVARARAAEQRARKILAERSQRHIDIERAEAALRRALVRQLATQRYGQSVERI